MVCRLAWDHPIRSPTEASSRHGRRWSSSSTPTMGHGNPTHPTSTRPKKPCWRSQPEKSTRPGPQRGSKIGSGSSREGWCGLDRPTLSVRTMALTRQRSRGLPPNEAHGVRTSGARRTYSNPRLSDPWPNRSRPDLFPRFTEGLRNHHTTDR